MGSTDTVVVGIADTDIVVDMALVPGRLFGMAMVDMAMVGMAIVDMALVVAGGLGRPVVVVVVQSLPQSH